MIPRPTIRRASRLLAWAGLAITVDALAALGPAPARRRGSLVVRLDDIGDYLLWRRAAASLRSALPGPITLIAERAWANLAVESGCFDEVWPVDYKRLVKSPRYRLALLRRVRRAGFEAAVNPVHSRDLGARGGPLWGDALVRASGAPMRVAAGGESGGLWGLPGRVTDRWYTRLVPTAAGVTHETHRHEMFLLGLSGAPPEATEPPPLPGLGDLPAQAPSGDYYVLIPGAKVDFKRWPVDRFAEIARRLHQHTGWRGVVCGGPAEAELGTALAGHEPPVDDLVGRTSLPGLLAVIAAARLVVTNDTAAAHFAAAAGTPAVCVLGGGHYGRFLPYPEGGPRVAVHPMDCFGCGWDCIFPRHAGRPHPCIERVSVDDVWRQVLALVEPDGHPIADPGLPPEHAGTR